ncbi:hypothetical protein [Pontibacter chitinilyticus]|uniref:hypothetical protein n=1 Tax=Pontibacter chitinilyticus TaxID=2674989 RepID=UPI00321AC739
MKINRKVIMAMTAIGFTFCMAACGNNGDLPKEDDYTNTTESAPESTDNLTGYGNITDSTGTDTASTNTGASTGTTEGSTTAGTTAGSSTDL